MPYVTTWERDAKAEGLAEGLAEGMQKGEAKLILHLLTLRFGEISPKTRVQIETLSTTQLEALGGALFGFNKMADLTNWLNLSKKERNENFSLVIDMTLLKW